MKKLFTLLSLVIVLLFLTGISLHSQTLYSVSLDKGSVSDNENSINAFLNATGDELLVTGTTTVTGSNTVEGLIASFNSNDLSLNWAQELEQVQPVVSTFS